MNLLNLPCARVMCEYPRRCSGLYSPYHVLWPPLIYKLSFSQKQNTKKGKTYVIYLLPVFWANKVARESGHVAGLSRPSDQPNPGRYRSFCKKGSWTYQKQCPRSRIFSYEPLNFRENMFSTHHFCKKALELNKNRAHGLGILLMNPWNSGKLCLQPIIFWKGTRTS
jgi:hypothetical protein